MIAILGLAGAALAFSNTTTVETTNYVTIPCETPTTLVYGSSTYTVTEATTLTVEDCGCTEAPKAPASTAPAVVPASSAPVLANGAPRAAIGGAAGVAAAIAYLI